MTPLLQELGINCLQKFPRSKYLDIFYVRKRHKKLVKTIVSKCYLNIFHARKRHKELDKTKQIKFFENSTIIRSQLHNIPTYIRKKSRAQNKPKVGFWGSRRNKTRMQGILF